jgi:hypothetical protein
MDADAHVELCSLVDFLSMVFGTVHEEATDDAFAYVGVLVVLVDGELGVGHVDLNSLEETG